MPNRQTGSKGRTHTLRRLLTIALRLLPSRAHIVVHGWGDDEGNAVEVLRYLAEHYDERVYWLVDTSRSKDLLLRLSPLQGQPPDLIPRRSIRALMLFLTARGVFHTHGLFASPRPCPGKTHVSLWHGDGPKRDDESSHFKSGSFSYVVAGTELWGRQKLAPSGARSDQLLVVGNPRIDQFDRSMTDETLMKLGIDPTRPFVLWMPTFRAATHQGSKLWTDSPSMLLDDTVKTALDAWLERSRADRIQFVVKPHPLDSDAFERLDLIVVRTEALADAGVSTYQLLARSSALVTDYSSVWPDYLVLDRPVLLFCPDLSIYGAKRGFNVPSLYDVAPGGLTTTIAGLKAFMSEVQAGLDVQCDDRHRVAKEIGAVLNTGATTRLFKRLCFEGSLCIHASAMDCAA